MRVIIYFVAVVLCTLTACQSSTTTTAVTADEVSLEPLQLTQARAEVKELMTAFHASQRGKSPTGMDSIFTANSLYCGTAPHDFMDKELIVWSIGEAAKVEAIKIEYELLSQKIRMSDNGQSAVILEIMVMPFISTVPIRQISHAIQKDGRWQLDFMSISLVPAEEDLSKINAAVPEFKKPELKELWNE